MLKRLRKKLNMNNNGNVMSIALIVIAVLTFSLNTVTSMTLNISGQTNATNDQINSQNTAEGLIDEAISIMDAEILSQNAILSESQINALYVGTGIDASTTGSNTITITDETDITTGYGSSGGIEIRLYKFWMTLDNGQVLSKYLHVTTGETSIELFEPFNYSLGTNGDLILNGGYYNNIFMFGTDVYLSKIAPYYNYATGDQANTPTASASDPYLTTPGTMVSTPNSKLYCGTSSCYNTASSNNFYSSGTEIEMDKTTFGAITTNPTMPGEDDPVTINDFFGTFNYQDYVVNYVKNTGPTDGNGTITDAMTLGTIGSVVAANADAPTFKKNGSVKNWPSTPYADLTGNSSILFGNPKPTVAVYYDATSDPGGALTINNNFTLSDGGQFDTSIALVVNGDLIIDSSGSLNLQAMIIVTGDLYIQGDDVDFEGALYIMGVTYINFNDNKGILTPGNNTGFTLLTNDHIFVQNIFSNHNGPETTASSAEFDAFFYTEESIFVDAVNSNFHIDGSLYARAAGNSGSYFPVIDANTLQTIHGIVINSYRGHISGAGTPVPDPVTSNLTSHGFKVEVNNSSQYINRFMSIPTFDSLVTTPGTVSTFTGEFSLN